MDRRPEMPAVSASSRREHETRLDPVPAGFQALFALTRAIGAQCLEADLRQCERSPALLGFQRLQDETMVDDLQLLANVQLTGLQVDVFPAETRGFAESEAAGKRDTEQWTEPM